MALSYTLELSEAQLQSKLTAMMPIEMSKYFCTVTLSEPEIELIEGDDEISVFCHIDALISQNIKGSGRAKIVGSLDYFAETSEFHLIDPKIAMLEIDSVAEKYTSQLKSIVQWVASKILATRAVYQLKDNTLKHKLAKSMLQSVLVKNKKVLLKLSVI